MSVVDCAFTATSSQQVDIVMLMEGWQPSQDIFSICFVTSSCSFWYYVGLNKHSIFKVAANCSRHEKPCPVFIEETTISKLMERVLFGHSVQTISSLSNILHLKTNWL